jgi:hypothetical protein
MGWLEGLLTGYADRTSEIRKENAAAAEAATGREAAIYKALLDSPDPKIKATAAVGLLQTAQPNKLKGGFGGWLGQMEEHPAYAPLVKYMSTPQQVGEDVKTTTTTPEQAGYLPTLPSNKPAAQTATQTTTPGAPGPATPLPMPPAGPPPAPPAGLTGAPDAGPGAPPTVPPEMLGSLPGPTSAVPGGGVAAAPPPPPPSIGQLGPDQLRGQLAPETAPAPLVQTTRTPVMALPHAFPTTEDNEITAARAKGEGEFQYLVDVGRRSGQPNPAKWAADQIAANMAKSQGTPYRLEQVEWTDENGEKQAGWGSYNQRTGGFNLGDGTALPQNAHILAKPGAGGALKIEDEAAQKMGFPDSHAVPPNRLEEYRTTLNGLVQSKAGAQSAGTAEGRYKTEMARVNATDVQRAAWEIAHDFSKASLFMKGSQAFKDRVMTELTNKGYDVNKISEATRQMAETAQDILPMMDSIADDAKKFSDLGMMGPIQGRWQDFLTGKIGVTELAGDDPAKQAIAGKFRTEVDLLQKAVLRAHAGARGAGSPEGLDRMEQMLNISHMDLPTFLSSMSGFQGWMQQYAKHLPSWGARGQEPDPNVPPPPETPDRPVPTDMNAYLQQMVAKYATTPGVTNGLDAQMNAPLRIDPSSGKLAK